MRAAELPFKYAAVISILLLSVALTGMVFSFYFCAFDLYHRVNHNYTVYAVLFIGAMVFVFLA